MFALTAAFAALALAGSSYAVPVNSTALASRAYTGARFTWYHPNVGQGACGGWNQDTDFVSSETLALLMSLISPVSLVTQVVALNWQVSHDMALRSERMTDLD